MFTAPGSKVVPPSSQTPGCFHELTSGYPHWIPLTWRCGVFSGCSTSDSPFWVFFLFWRIFLNFKLKGLLEKCELVPEKQCHNRAIRVDPPLQQFHDQHFVGATPPRGSWRRRRVRWFEGEDGFAQSEHSDGTSGLADLSKDRMDN